MRRSLLEIRALAAGLLTATLVVGLIALAVQIGLLRWNDDLGWIMAVVSPLVVVIVSAQFLKNRGVD